MYPLNVGPWQECAFSCHCDSLSPVFTLWTFSSKVLLLGDSPWRFLQDSSFLEKPLPILVITCLIIYCYSFYLECPPRAQVLNAWSWAHGVLEDNEVWEGGVRQGWPSLPKLPLWCTALSQANYRWKHSELWENRGLPSLSVTYLRYFTIWVGHWPT